MLVAGKTEMESLLQKNDLEDSSNDIKKYDMIYKLFYKNIYTKICTYICESYKFLDQYLNSMAGLI